MPFLWREGEEMAKNVTTIPATRNRFTADPISSRKKRRVAGYARVSTDMEDQQQNFWRVRFVMP